MKKTIIALVLACALNAGAQTYPKNWHLNYSATDTSYGIDLVNAMKNTPAPASAKPVIVAVIDNGTDIRHSDLSGNIWVNEKEIPGNSVDDDHNGYIDDVNGWDFLGNIGEDIEYDNLEMTRLLRDYKKRFDGKTSKTIAKSDQADFRKFKKLEKEFNTELAEARASFENIAGYKKALDKLIEELDSTNISLKDLEAFTPEKPENKLIKVYVVQDCRNSNQTPKEYFDAIFEYYKHLYAKVNYQLSLEFDPREKIGDNYLDPNDNKYGNNEVKGPEGEHGTHVAGIIGAIRDNSYPAQGIAPMVKLMIIRAVPDGDERDKDVALAIRYAVDNGAKVINMSFGKAYSFNKKIVDDAVKYAESKDVLIIHAAGNDNQDNDKGNNFPNPRYEDGTTCKTWIEVGASDRDQTPAGFSNYGKKNVDVFAPGVKIYSTFPDNKYKAIDGTSMASPVVAGLAGLIRAYYPSLTAVQVKQVIESSVDKPLKKVRKPGKKKKKTKYRKLSRTAGIVNADKALKAASAIK
jgi:subtilisin family serine protease